LFPWRWRLLLRLRTLAVFAKRPISATERLRNLIGSRSAQQVVAIMTAAAL
jgi:hypothetical protein